MKNNTNVITTKQLIFTIISATLGVGILTLTSSVGRVSRQDAWISIGLGAILPLVGLFCIHLICKRFPHLTFVEYSERILGKWLGKTLSIFFVVYALIYAGLVARIFVGVLKIYLFPLTPIWALGILILLVSAYLAAKDARVLGRVNELMFYEALVLFAFIFGAVPQMDLTYFQPVGESGMITILKGTYESIFSYLGIEVLLVFYALVQNKKEIVRAGLTAILVITVIYLTVSVTIIGIFGPNVIENIRFGVMVLLKTYQAPVIERAEFFFIIFWVFVAFRPVANMYFVGRFTLEKIIGIESPSITTVCLFPFILAVVLIPQNFEQAVSYSSKLGFAGMALITILPVTLWGIASLRRIGGEQGYA